MKTKNLMIAVLLSMAVFSGCKKDEAVVAPVLVGTTYSGISYSYPGIGRFYEGYKFISETRALVLVLDGDVVIGSSEVGYSYDYPNLKIETIHTNSGFYYASFAVDGSFVVAGITMTKN